MFQRARHNETPSLVADGGDFVPGEGESLRVERADLMLEAMELMSYDAVGIGELELALGVDYLKQAADRLPLVSANVRVAGIEIPELRLVDAGGHRIAVTAYLDPLLFYELPGALEIAPESLLVVDPVESLGQLLQHVRIEADLVVVLAHASREHLEDVLTRIPPVDVIIQGHEPDGARRMGRVHDTLLVVPGARSRHVSLLNLTLDADNQLQRTNYRVVYLSQFGRADQRLDDLVNEFEQVHGIR